MDDRVSALMDGELDDAGVRSCLDSMLADPRLREDWALFHLIGDHLRETSPQAIEDSSAGESRRYWQEVLPLQPPPGLIPARHRVFLPGVAALLGVGIAALAVLALPPAAPRSDTPPAVTVAHRLAGSIGAEAETRQGYLLAHQGVSPSAVLHGAGAYMRTVAAADDLHGDGRR